MLPLCCHRKIRARLYAYEAKDLLAILRPEFKAGLATTKASAAAVLSPYLRIGKSVDGGVEKLKTIAAKLVTVLKEEVRVADQMSPVYAQCYARDAERLGHHAKIIIVSAREWHLRVRRKALAAHLAEQRCLGRTEPFDDKAFLQQHPVPEVGAPDRVIGFEAQPKYSLGWQHFSPIWYMDVGSGRRRSPYNSFHIGGLDGNHHCHGMNTFIVDVESLHSWLPIMRSVSSRNPALNNLGARCIRDEHHGSAAAQIEVFPNAVPLNCNFHKRTHMLSDAAWGNAEERKALVALNDVCVRSPNAELALISMAKHKDAGHTKSYKKLRDKPLEETFPCMRTHPTGRRKHPVIGPTFGQTTDQAETMMKAQLDERSTESVAQLIMLYFERDQRRWRKCVANLRKAQVDEPNQVRAHPASCHPPASHPTLIPNPTPSSISLDPPTSSCSLCRSKT
jgi:hypothetical protein